MTMDSPRCHNPVCGRPISQIPGHRRRQYCDDNCKQAAYLARKDATKRTRIAAEEAEKLRLEMAALHERWGDLLPETLLQLKALKDKAGMTIADQVVATLKKEAAHGSKCEELTDFWVKREQSVRRVNNRTDVPGKTASHLVFFS